jgi:diphosphomevalonate decarboxylase
LKSDHDEIYSWLVNHNYEIESIPESFSPQITEVPVITKAYGIQGILKYHGLSNPKERIGYFPSISINNSSVTTFSHFEIHPKNERSKDIIIINGKQTNETEKQSIRVQTIMNFIRNAMHVDFSFKMISRNLNSTTGRPIVGKGMGTSASAGASLTEAVFSRLFTHAPAIQKNTRLKSIYSRLFAGSASRSMVGGIALWLNYPGIPSNDSFAIRLDRPEKKGFIDSISLINIEIESNVQTDSLHSIAPNSIFFEPWLLDRKARIFQLFEAISSQNVSLFGALAEFDTNCLHAISNTAKFPPEPPLINELTLIVVHFIYELRKQGFDLYYSIDTGPSVVVLCRSKDKNEILALLKDNIPKIEDKISEGSIAGPPEIIQNENELPEIFREDLEKYAR